MVIGGGLVLFPHFNKLWTVCVIIITPALGPQSFCTVVWPPTCTSVRETLKESLKKKARWDNKSGCCLLVWALIYTDDDDDDDANAIFFPYPNWMLKELKWGKCAISRVLVCCLFKKLFELYFFFWNGETETGRAIILKALDGIVSRLCTSSLMQLSLVCVYRHTKKAHAVWWLALYCRVVVRSSARSVSKLTSAHSTRTHTHTIRSGRACEES